MRFTVSASICRSANGDCRCFQNRPDKTAEDEDRNDDAGPIESRDLFRIAPCEQNCKNDQHRDGADVNEDLDQTNELSAEQEEKCRNADKCDDKGKRA